jgi:hypothetical protein
MTELQAFRDDGPLAAWLARRAGHDVPSSSGRLGWLVPPALRVIEYGAIVALTAVADSDAMPACYALLAVLAFHHYDIVYRLRTQGQAPPAWVGMAGGGWDGRLIAVAVVALVAGDALGVLLLVAAVVLGALFAGESIASWRGFAHSERTAEYLDQDLEEA